MADRPRRDAKAIFLEAVENHPPEEWEAYLNEACGTDISLRRLVGALLRAHREKDSVFDRDFTIPRGGLSGLSQISLPDVTGEDDPLAIRGTREHAPDRVGRYRIEGELARGGVGAVYKAHDDDLGRSLAVKVLLDDHRRDPEMLDRFMEEAQITGQLQHPGIVPVHDVGLFMEQRPYFAMKLIKGQTLAKVLSAREDPAQERQRFLGVFEHICETIAYAHARGVIHRDLKPSNVMLGSFGEVQVVDWGLAKVIAQGGIADDGRAGSAAGRTAIATVRSGSTASDSLAGSVLGTPAYMSPEQARGDIDDLDERSDVFGLGAILCETLTGKPPYVAATARELLNRAKKGYLDDAWARIDACGADRELTELARRCLSFEPRSRPRDAGAVLKEVRGYLESLEERARTMEIRAAKTRMKMMLAITVALALSMGAGVLVWLSRERRERADAASSAVADIVAEARELRAAASARDPTDAAAWNHALDKIARAGPLITDEVNEETLRALAREKAAIETEIRRCLLRARLEELRDSPIETFNAPRMDARYADLFRDFLERDVEEMETAEAADLIRATGMKEALARAIGEWAAVRARADGRESQKLLDLAIASDPRPFRLRGEQLLASPRPVDVRRFLSSVDSAQATADDLVLFARVLVSRDELAGAETALRAALRKAPGNFRVVLELGRLLRRHGRPGEAIDYAYVAKSLRPGDSAPWLLLGELLEETQDYDAALEAFVHVATLKPEDEVSYRSLRSLLSRDNIPEFGRDAADRTVSALTRLATTGQGVRPPAREVLRLVVSRLGPADGR